MIPNSKSIQRILLVLIGGFIVGCQSDPSSLHRSNFAEIWRTYQACRSAEKIDELVAHARTVEDMTLLRDRGIPTGDLDSTSQGTLTKLVQPLKTRLAVDPHAMNADCLLHTGQIAYRQGHIVLAQDLFGRVLRVSPNTELRYYVEAAQLGLLRIDQDLQATVEQAGPSSRTN